MRSYGIKLSPRHKQWFYSVAVLLFLSGALWLVFGWLADQEGTHTDLFRSIKSWSLKLHGAATMAFLVALGILIPTHLRRAWLARRNRINGVFIAAAMAALVATGYGLYYFGDEQWRSASSWIHRIVGLASPVVLIAHIWLGKRRTPPRSGLRRTRERSDIYSDGGSDPALAAKPIGSNLRTH